MIVLHNPLERQSRDFVELYCEGHTVLEYPDCVEQYPAIRAFPSVVLPLPERFVPRETLVTTADGDTTELHWWWTSPVPDFQFQPDDWADVEDTVAGLVLTTPNWELHLDLIEEVTGVRPTNKDAVDQWITAAVNRQVTRLAAKEASWLVRQAVAAMAPDPAS